MTTVLKYQISKPSIHQINESRKTDPWCDVDGVPSEVGIEGKLVLDTTLRNSVSIKDAYKMQYLPSELHILFVKIKIGMGSKHIYKPGGFMKKHYDSRLPSFNVKQYNQETRKNELVAHDHIMTLILIKNYGYYGGDLYVEDKLVVSSEGAGNLNFKPYVAVLFSLNASHEVKPVTSGLREVFVFPIYGVYNPTESICRYLQIKDASEIKDLVLKELKQELLNILSGTKEKDPGDQRAMTQGFVTILDDSTALEMFVKYRQALGDYVSGYDEFEGPTVLKAKVTYTLSGHPFEMVVLDEFHVPNTARNVKVTVVNAAYQILEGLIDHVTNNVQVAVTPKPGWRNDIFQELDEGLPKNPFVVFLTGKYFSDAPITELTPEDKKAYTLVNETGRKVTFVPNGRWYSDQSNITGVTYKDGKFVKEIPASSRSYVLHVEFDDQGSYDPEYILAYGMLVVE